MYTIKPYGTRGRFELLSHSGARIGIYDSVLDAKRCTMYEDMMAVRVYDDTEVEFDERNPIHFALRRIEYRNNEFNEIVAVGEKHYLIRRNRWGVEVPIQYKVRDDAASGWQIVAARNDFEVVT